MKNRKIKQLESWGEITGSLASSSGDVYGISLETLNVIDVMFETIHTVLDWYKNDNVIFILVTLEDE